jgi:DNA-binding response OmpR family regulator
LAMKKIFIVEDDKALLKTLTASLQAENFKVISACDGEEGFKLCSKEKLDLIILDLVLPSMDGMEICRQLRSKGITTPIIMLTGQKKDETDKVLGFEVGADDYVTKPFGTKELLARIRAVLRRAEPEAKEVEQFSFGDISINFKRQTAFKGKKELYLTAKEFALLKFLISHEGELVTRETLLNEVWGYDQFPTTRTIDTFIHHLREKIEKDPANPRHLLTVPWSGYKFQK